MPDMTPMEALKLLDSYIRTAKISPKCPDFLTALRALDVLSGVVQENALLRDDLKSLDHGPSESAKCDNSSN
jgi:predicted hydrolase (HD superfamily)